MATFKYPMTDIEHYDWLSETEEEIQNHLPDFVIQNLPEYVRECALWEIWDAEIKTAVEDNLSVITKLISRKAELWAARIEQELND